VTTEQIWLGIPFHPTKVEPNPNPPAGEAAENLWLPCLTLGSLGDISVFGGHDAEGKVVSKSKREGSNDCYQQ